MRKFLKNDILNLLQTLYEAHNEVNKFINKKDFESAKIVLVDLQRAALQIGTTIENSEGKGFVTSKYIAEYCKVVFEISQNISENSTNIDYQKILDAPLIIVENSVKADIKIKLEVIFLSYKAAMWDSLESIWKAANDDPDCDAYVVPIPYYDRNPDHSLGKFHYEGNEYPDYVPVTDYRKYDYKARRPDIVYIHNPYDDCNYVTSVHPDYYSRKLKKYTDCLVYVPYAVSGSYATPQSAKRNIPVCINNVDIAILQSEGQRKALAITKELAEKMVVLGSPKFDKIKNLDCENIIPSELKEKIGGRKTILVNSTISKILCDETWSENIKSLIQIFENNKNIFMIWRPHPLLMATIEAMRPYQKSKMISVINNIDKLENAYVDKFSSADISIAASDALISDYSSIALQYMATEKPILLTVSSSASREKVLISCDYFSNYFVNDGTSFEQFCTMVCNNQDYKKEERMKYFYNSTVNLDGTCGLKIHKYVKNIVEI